MSAPLVTVVIPHYNSARFLPSAVESALRQSVPAAVVVVDDGSAERDAAAALAAAGSAGARVIRAPHGGVSRARNAGIEAARTPYIIPLDADDLLEPVACETALAALDSRPGTGIVAWAQRLFGDAAGIRPCAYAGLDSMWDNTTIPNTSLFRRADWERVGGYPAGITVGEDWVFWMRLLRAGVRVEVLDDVLSRYRVSRHQTTRSIDPRRVAETRNLILAENAAAYPKESLAAEVAHLRTMNAHYRHNYRLVEALRRRLTRLRTRS